MKLGGSWIAMLIASLLEVITASVIIITLLHVYLKKQRNKESPEEQSESTYSSRVNSRKASKVSANLSTNDYHPFGSLQQFQECGLDKMNNLDGIGLETGAHVDEKDNEYTIPELDDDFMQSCDDILENHRAIQEMNPGEDNSDLTASKLSDFSSQPLPMNAIEDHEPDLSLNNQRRSIAFENMLYADQDEMKL